VLTNPSGTVSTVTRVKVVAAVVAALSLSPAAAAAPFTLVQVDRSRAAEAAPALQLHRAEQVSPALGVWRVRTTVARQVVPQLRRAGLVVAAEPDRVVATTSHTAPTDELFPHQWWFSRVGADRAEPPGRGRPVTIIDSGLDVSHPEFASRPDTLLLNVQTTAPLRRPEQSEYHGTSVASVVAAPANGVGVVGVYPQAVLRSYDAAPAGDITLATIVEGLDIASRAGAGVINLSLGGPFQSDILEAMVAVAYGRGSLVVAASGNSRQEGSPEEFPANYPHVLTVGATDVTDAVAEFSSAARLIDLVAPGEDIPVAVPLAFSSSGYSLSSGTSFSAPLVSGAAAWVWTARPELDNTQLFQVMRRSARDIGAPGWDRDSGFGILDIPTALTLPPPPRDPMEPNDDFDFVRGGGELTQASLTTRSRGRGRVLATVDAREDPDDVYRVYVPAGRSVTVTVRATVGDADLELWSNDARTVHERTLGLTRNRLGRSARAGAVETVTWANRARGPRMVYADVYARGGGEATYLLSVTTKALPKRSR
jgi:hypothetical protein